tara:strand:- start:110 stop:220 length:111 start_codon:yes stop_codon:yes gene_type:complete
MRDGAESQQWMGWFFSGNQHRFEALPPATYQKIRKI